MNFNSCFMFLINYGHPLVGDDDQDDWAGRKQSQQGGRKWQTARKEVFNLISPSRIFGPILPSRIFEPVSQSENLNPRSVSSGSPFEPMERWEVDCHWVRGLYSSLFR